MKYDLNGNILENGAVYLAPKNFSRLTHPDHRNRLPVINISSMWFPKEIANAIVQYSDTCKQPKKAQAQLSTALNDHKATDRNSDLIVAWLYATDTHGNDWKLVSYNSNFKDFCLRIRLTTTKSVFNEAVSRADLIRKVNDNFGRYVAFGTMF